MIEFGGETYTVSAQLGKLPLSYDLYVRNAAFHDDLGIVEREGKPAVVTIGRNDASWPFLVVSLRCPNWMPSLGALLVPETDLLLVGCGNNVLAYDLKKSRRLWRKEAFGGFWNWRRHDDIVLMSGELEFIAYSTAGKQLWEAFVEPPWSYEVVEGTVDLDVMGHKSRLLLHTGRPV